VILCDNRAGSIELYDPLIAAGLPVELTQMPFGDLAFAGRGAGTPLLIGLEHKKLPDLVQSLADNRLAGHQLLGLVNPANYDRAYLIIEGEWDADSTGRVCRQLPIKGRRVVSPLKGAPPAIELEKRVLTLAHRGGLHVRWTRSQAETVRFVTALYRWWSDEDLEDHRSHLAIYAPDFDPVLREPLTTFRKGLDGLVDGVGFAMSKAVENAVFDAALERGSWERLRAMTVDDLADIAVVTSKGKTRRLGPAKAKQIKEALR
jgi:hypothetical protein